MRKNIIIAILTVVSLMELALLNRKPTDDANNYWLQRTIAAEDVIYRVYEDNDTYVLDVLQESMEWSNWVSIAEKQEERG